MQTDKRIQLISQMIDANWEVSQHFENNIDEEDFHDELIILQENFEKAKQELIDEIGLEEFNNFMTMGKKMFAPKQLDEVEL